MVNFPPRRSKWHLSKLLKKSTKKVKTTCARERSGDGFERSTPSVSSLFGFNFPWWCKRGKGKKKKEKKNCAAQRLLGVFVMSPPRQCVCMHISDPERERERDGDKDQHRARAQMCTHKHRGEKEGNPPRIIRSVTLSKSDPPPNLEHHRDTSGVI